MSILNRKAELIYSVNKTMRFLHLPFRIWFTYSSPTQVMRTDFTSYTYITCEHGNSWELRDLDHACIACKNADEKVMREIRELLDSENTNQEE